MKSVLEATADSSPVVSLACNLCEARASGDGKEEREGRARPLRPFHHSSGFTFTALLASRACAPKMK